MRAEYSNTSGCKYLIDHKGIIRSRVRVLPKGQDREKIKEVPEYFEEQDLENPRFLVLGYFLAGHEKKDSAGKIDLKRLNTVPRTGYYRVFEDRRVGPNDVIKLDITNSNSRVKRSKGVVIYIKDCIASLEDFLKDSDEEYFSEIGNKIK